MRKTLWSAWALAVLLGTTGLCRADEGAKAAAKPLAVVSFAGYDALMTNLNYLAIAADNPMLPKMLEATVQMATNGQGLAGLDKSRPWGATVQFDGQQPPVVTVFLPVTDLKQLLTALQGTLGGPPKDTGNGVYEVTTPARTVFAKQKGTWAFVATAPELLANTPDDPAALLGELPKKYLAAVRILVGNIPDSVRAMALGVVRQGFLAGVQGQAGGEFALDKQVDKILASVTAVLDQLNHVTYGLAVDATAQTVSLDAAVVFKDGSKMARDAAADADPKTRHAGFQVPGAAVAFNWAGKVSAEQAAQSQLMIDSMRAKTPKALEQQGLNEEQVKQAKQIVESLLDVLQDTIKGGHRDAALSLAFDPKPTLMAGLTVCSGMKVDKAFRDLVAAVAKDQPDVAKMVKLDLETAGPLHFHGISIPIPPEIPPAKVFGEKLELVLGVSDQALYFSGGHEPLKALKQAIAKSAADGEKACLPLRLTVALAPIFKFASEVGDGQTRMMAGVLSQVLAQSGGKDHITLTATVVPNGGQGRLEIEQGVIKVFGQLYKMKAAPAGR